MINTTFILTSLTAFTVVLANMPYKSNKEKYMDLLKMTGLNVKKQSGLLVDEPVNLSGLDSLENKAFGIQKPQGVEFLHMFKRNADHTPKACSITIRKIERQPGVCLRLIDNTPACHNKEYLAIDQDC